MLKLAKCILQYYLRILAACIVQASHKDHLILSCLGASKPFSAIRSHRSIQILSAYKLGFVSPSEVNPCEFCPEMNIISLGFSFALYTTRQHEHFERYCVGINKENFKAGNPFSPELIDVKVTPASNPGCNGSYVMDTVIKRLQHCVSAN
jgi:hypothetical protein